jgi:arylsulfatase
MCVPCRPREHSRSISLHFVVAIGAGCELKLRSSRNQEADVADKKPNIVFFFWDNFGWGEMGCYGGGVLRGAPTPRVDKLASEGLQLLNHNVESQCTPSRSAVLTGRHAIRSGTAQCVLPGMGQDGMTRWEVTIAQALSDAGYATGMWGKWHLGSDPNQRGPVDFGFDEAVWCPRTADETLWPEQTYFPKGEVSGKPFVEKWELGYEPIYSRKKGEKAETIATYDAEYRALFDRKITEYATDFMTRAHQEGKPFYLYLPMTQVHNPVIPDPEYVGKTGRGTWPDVLTQIDDFTGVILDHLDSLGVADDTIVVWTADNGPEGYSDYSQPSADKNSNIALQPGSPGPWRGPLFTSLEGGLRTAAIVRYPGRVPAGKVSNEIVHEVDWFTTLILEAGGTVPGDRIIDGLDMRDFLLGDATESGRDVVLCMDGNRLHAIKWRQWKVHIIKQDDIMGTWEAFGTPRIFNLEWDMREEHSVFFGHIWVLQTAALAAMTFLKSLAAEPPIKPGTPDPYVPPKPGDWVVEEELQVGAITKYAAVLHPSNGGPPKPAHEHQPEHGMVGANS